MAKAEAVFINENDQKMFDAVCKHLRKSCNRPVMDRRECLNLALTYYIKQHDIKVE